MKNMVSKFAAKMKKREKTTPDLKTSTTSTISEVIQSELLYDYNKLAFNENDKNSLITFEKELLLQKRRIGEVALIMGDTLEKARNLFSRYDNGDESSYIDWYSSLGFNKDQVYLLRGRYRLTLEYPTYKNNILALSDVEVKEVINKQTPKYIVNRVLQGEIRTAKKIKEERATSRVLEIGDDGIEEAKIILDKDQERLKEIENEIFKLETKLKVLREERSELMEKIKNKK